MLPRRLLSQRRLSARRLISLGPPPLAPKPQRSTSASPSPSIQTTVSPPPSSSSPLVYEPFEGPPPHLAHNQPRLSSPVTHPKESSLLSYFRRTPQTALTSPNAATALASGPHEDWPLPFIRTPGTRLPGEPNPTWQEIKENSVVSLRGLWMLGVGLFCGLYLSIAGHHLFAEAWALRAPSALYEPDGKGGEAKDWGHRRDPFGFELTNDANWSGGLKGGTDATQLEQWQARFLLRNAWFSSQEIDEQEYDRQRASRGGATSMMDGEPEGPKGFEANLVEDVKSVRDWIAKDAGWNREWYQATLAGGARSLESSINRTIIEARAYLNPVRFPSLRSTNDDPLPLPSPVAPPTRRPRVKEDEVGQALLLRLAEVKEDLGTEESLQLAKNAYEGVLRDVVDCEGAETLEGRLAEKVAKLEAVLGGKAEDWVVWGIARLTGWDGSGAGGGDVVASKHSVTSRLAAWFLPSSWSTSSPTSLLDPSLVSSPSTPSLLSLFPPLPTLLASIDPATTPPARLRTLISLLVSLSSLQSNPASLLQAQQTQLATQTLLDAALAHLDLPNPLEPETSMVVHLSDKGSFGTYFEDWRQGFTRRKKPKEDRYEQARRTASERLHQLSLLLSKAIVDLHRAEVEYALRPRGVKHEEKRREVEREVLARVNDAFERSASILWLLMPPHKKGEQVLPSYLPFPPPKTLIPSHPGTQFTAFSVLQRPAQDLLDSAARASASAANLLGLLALAGVGEDKDSPNPSSITPSGTPTTTAPYASATSLTTLPLSSHSQLPSAHALSLRRAHLAKHYLAYAGLYTGAYLFDDEASAIAAGAKGRNDWVGTRTVITSPQWVPFKERRMLRGEWQGYEQRWEGVREDWGV